MREVVIVAYGRSAIGKAGRGCFSQTRPEYLGSEVLKGVLDKIPNLNRAEIDDIIVGCSFPESQQGFNMARIIGLAAGLPHEVSGHTVNRFCSSGSQAIATGANSIIAGQAEVVVVGGVESMSAVPMGGNNLSPYGPLVESPDGNPYTPMGLTAENVANKYGITREQQDAFSLESHQKAQKAQVAGKFDDEIIPVTVTRDFIGKDGKVTTKSQVVTKDEGIRYDMQPEQLAKLRPVFAAKGSVTAGNASQMSDGAAFLVLMSREKAEELNLTPLARFVSFAVAGCEPALMGMGPYYAIPKVLKNANLSLGDIDLFELNEAFASQAIACCNELNIDMDKVNVNGGAISLGHPLGCTGGFLAIKLINELKRQNKKYGIVSMCIGGGMGAASIYEVL